MSCAFGSIVIKFFANGPQEPPKILCKNNFLLCHPLCNFLAYALFKIPPLAEISSWTWRRDLAITEVTWAPVLVQILFRIEWHGLMK